MTSVLEKFARTIQHRCSGFMAIPFSTSNRPLLALGLAAVWRETATNRRNPPNNPQQSIRIGYLGVRASRLAPVLRNEAPASSP